MMAGVARGPRRVVVALSISTFVEWAGAGSMMPLLPLYLRKLGAPVAFVGVVMAASFFSPSSCSTPSGAYRTASVAAPSN
jgi:hypothetical protein